MNSTNTAAIQAKTTPIRVLRVMNPDPDSESDEAATSGNDNSLGFTTSPSSASSTKAVLSPTTSPNSSSLRATAPIFTPATPVPDYFNNPPTCVPEGHYLRPMGPPFTPHNIHPVRPSNTDSHGTGSTATPNHNLASSSQELCFAQDPYAHPRGAVLAPQTRGERSAFTNLWNVAKGNFWHLAGELNQPWPPIVDGSNPRPGPGIQMLRPATVRMVLE